MQGRQDEGIWWGPAGSAVPRAASVAAERRGRRSRMCSGHGNNSQALQGPLRLNCTTPDGHSGNYYSRASACPYDVRKASSAVEKPNAPSMSAECRSWGETQERQGLCSVRSTAAMGWRLLMGAHGLREARRAAVARQAGRRARAAPPTGSGVCADDFTDCPAAAKGRIEKDLQLLDRSVTALTAGT